MIFFKNSARSAPLKECGLGTHLYGLNIFYYILSLVKYRRCYIISREIVSLSCETVAQATLFLRIC